MRARIGVRVAAWIFRHCEGYPTLLNGWSSESNDPPWQGLVQLYLEIVVLTKGSSYR